MLELTNNYHRLQRKASILATSKLDRFDKVSEFAADAEARPTRETPSRHVKTAARGARERHAQ
eukprot:6105578-Pleurochrysis_carterae.AAC.1